MAKFTLLEVHLDGAEFTANAPYSDAESAGDGVTDTLSFGGDEDDGTGAAADDSGSNPFGIVLAFAALVVATVVVRRLLGGSGEPALEQTDGGEAESGGLRARL